MDTGSTMKLVVDGQLLEDKTLGDGGTFRPQNMSILLGSARERASAQPGIEYTGQTSGLNIFSLAPSQERM